MHLADLRVFTEPQQGATYDDLLAVARRAEQLGLRRLLPQRPLPQDGQRQRAARARPTRGSCSPVWRATRRRSGSARSCRRRRSARPASWRSSSPASTRCRAAASSSASAPAGTRPSTVPTASRSRTSTARFDNLEEQLAIVSGLWSTPPGETFSYEGAIWQLHDSPALPKPVQPDGPPIIVGGKGPIAHPGARRALRRRVQHVRRHRPVPRAVHARRGGVRGDRPRSGVDDVLGCGGAVLRRRRGRVPAPGGGDRPRSRRVATQLGGRDARRGCGATPGVERGRCRPHLPADARPLRPRTSRPRRRTGGARSWIETGSALFLQIESCLHWPTWQQNADPRR